jgi:hypothetical protein
MRIDTMENYNIRLKDVFSPVMFETDEGEKLLVCMRDGAFEISVKDTSCKVGGSEEYYRHYVVAGGAVKETLGVAACGSRDSETDPCENKKKHENSESCWCNPILKYEGGAAGNQVWAHNDI